MAATLMFCWRAIFQSESPDLTVYIWLSPDTGPAAAIGALASAVVGMTDAVAVVAGSLFAADGTWSFWPTLSALVLVRLLARARSPMLTPCDFAIFQSESPFLTTYVRPAVCAGAAIGVAAGVAGTRLFWAVASGGNAVALAAG